MTPKQQVYARQKAFQQYLHPLFTYLILTVGHSSTSFFKSNTVSPLKSAFSTLI